jgi:ribosome maturation factor RimP
LSKATSIFKAEKALAGLAESLGLEYIEHELKKESGELYLRLIIDKEGGLSLEDCEKFHRQCIPLVENVEYDYLECSSPGIERPLKKERDFQKNMGKQIEVRLFKQRDGQRIFFGTLQNYEEGSLGATFNISTQSGLQAFTLKETALVKPVIDYQAELSKGE